MYELEKTEGSGHLVVRPQAGTNSGLNGAGPVVPEMTSRDYIKVLFRQKFVIMITILTVSLATAIGLKLKTPQYESSVKMLISAEKQIDSPYYRDILAGRNVEATLTQSEIVKSKPVLERAMGALGLQKRPLDYEKNFASPLKRWVIDQWVKNLHLEKFPAEAMAGIMMRYVMEDLIDHIEVEPVRDTNLFSIKVRDFSPVGAAIIANTLSRSYVIFDLEQQYVELQSKYTDKNPIVVQMMENIKKMEKGLSGQPLPNVEAIGPATVKIIEQATPPLKPIGLPEKLIFVLAVLMSVFLGVFLAFMFQYLDQTFHSKQELENFIGAPVIACINKKKGLLERELVIDVSETNRSPRATSYRILSSQLIFMIKTKNLRTYLFASAHPADRSHEIVANEAIFLSKKLGLRTLVIDANLRHPRLHKLFGKPLENGLCDILDGKKNQVEAQKTVSDNLNLITVGKSDTDPGILLDASAFTRVLSALKPAFDVILIDGADLRDHRDSVLIAPCVDAVIPVIGESTVRRQVVAYSMKHLREARCHLAGAVMPNREYLIPKFLYESV